MGLMRKITTLVTSIIIYGHELNFTQAGGLGLSIGAMIYNFLDKSSSKKGKKKDPTTGSAAGPAAVADGNGGAPGTAMATYGSLVRTQGSDGDR